MVGTTPTSVTSGVIPPLWTGSTSDKEIVKQSELLNLLEEGDAVMADQGFFIWDILAFSFDIWVFTVFFQKVSLPDPKGLF